MLKAAIFLAGLLALGACARDGTLPVTTNVFDPLSFFRGEATSEGTVTTALVSTRAFTARFEGHEEGNALVLDEHFLFPEGPRLQRWHLAKTGEGRYGGTVETQGRDGALHAPVPVEGRILGAALELSYEGYAPGGDTLLGFRHRMVMLSDGTAENRVRVSKFGLPLASSHVIFTKVPGEVK